MDLEELLLEAKLSASHIDKLKRTTLKSKAKLDAIYDCVSDFSYQVIPVSKIKGISTCRGTVGVSWFDNFQDWEKHGFRDKTINNYFIPKLSTENIESIRSSFMLDQFSGENFKLAYFEEADEYYTVNGGSNRTLFAKIVDAPFLKAKVCKYKLNPIKERNFQAINDLKIKLNNIVEDLNLNTHVDDYSVNDIGMFIDYKSLNLLYFRYPNLIDYSDQKRIDEFIYKFNMAMKYILDVNEKYLFYMKFPRSWRLPIIRTLRMFKSNSYYSDIERLLENKWLV